MLKFKNWEQNWEHSIRLILEKFCHAKFNKANSAKKMLHILVPNKYDFRPKRIVNFSLCNFISLKKIRNKSKNNSLQSKKDLKKFVMLKWDSRKMLLKDRNCRRNFNEKNSNLREGSLKRFYNFSRFAPAHYIYHCY